MTDKRWVDALWSVYYDAEPLSKVSVWWTDYPDGCPSALPGFQPPPLLWSNVVYAERRAADGVQRPATFSRWGGPGSHRYPIGFSGDTFQHELSLDFEIYMTPTSANSLFGWWSHDIGGFHADRTNSPAACPGDSNPSNATGVELFSRWVQFGALAPILRTHCGGCGPEGPPNCSCDRRIWMFPSHFEFMRDAMRLRAALLPHLYTAARIFFDTGVAPVRALYIEFPDEDLAYSQNHTYMFGDILASPIHTFSPDGLSNVSVSVWLPQGVWAPWDGSAPVASDGSTRDTRAYGQNEIPLFVRADALLPLALDGTADIVETSPAIAWTVWDAGAAGGQGVLYEDDGFSQQFYARAAWLITEASFSWSAANLTLLVDAATGSYTGAPPTRASALHVRGWGRTRNPPTAVLVNGTPVSQGNSTPGWSIVSAQPGEPALTAPNGMLQVRVGALALNAQFDVVVLF
jgi:alpha-glucosidase (family GH31 glycosyl hydrolase)